MAYFVKGVNSRLPSNVVSFASNFIGASQKRIGKLKVSASEVPWANNIMKESKR